ncbi:MAG: ABC transporter substrate-binding protein [Deltaproteobacteria bacterium]|nr:ABC transporter substrate-binding protein [Deltaproteobacteria bacterium]
MRRILLIAAFVLSLCGAALAAPPARIVSLAPNVTEILYELGAGKRVAGVTDFCDWPPEAKEKSKVGGMINPSIEAIVSLRPDMVVMTTDGNPEEVGRKLSALGIQTHVLKARRLKELPDGIREIGKAISAEKEARALADRMEKAIEAYGQRGGKREDAPEKTLFVIWPQPLIVAGPSTTIDDAMGLLGLENMAKQAPTEYPRWSLEDVIRNSPEIIFIARGHADAEGFSRPLLEKLHGVDAVKNKRVYYVSDRILRLGPRIVEGIEEMEGLITGKDAKGGE